MDIVRCRLLTRPPAFTIFVDMYHPGYVEPARRCRGSPSSPRGAELATRRALRWPEPTPCSPTSAWAPTTSSAPAAFYDATLGVLGYSRCDTSAESETSWNGLGRLGPVRKGRRGAGRAVGLHAVQRRAGHRRAMARWWRCGRRPGAQVEAFHAAALAHGGTSEGAPGLRLQYNPDFYAAYVRDPDGNKLAVVCRGFTSAQGQ